MSKWSIYNSGSLPQNKLPLAQTLQRRMAMKFCTVACESEQEVYQLYNTFVGQKMFNESVLKTVSPLLIELTLDLKHKQVFNVNQINALFEEGCLANIQNKIVFIAGLNKTWSADLALLFWENMRKYGALGLVVYSPAKEGSFIQQLTQTPVTIHTL